MAMRYAENETLIPYIQCAVSLVLSRFCDLRRLEGSGIAVLIDNRGVALKEICNTFLAESARSQEK